MTTSGILIQNRQRSPKVSCVLFAASKRLMPTLREGIVSSPNPTPLFTTLPMLYDAGMMHAPMNGTMSMPMAPPPTSFAMQQPPLPPQVIAHTRTCTRARAHTIHTFHTHTHTHTHTHAHATTCTGIHKHKHVCVHKYS